MLSASINVRLVPLTDFAEFFIEAQRLHLRTLRRCLPLHLTEDDGGTFKKASRVCALFQLGLRLIDESVSSRLRRQPRHGIGLAGEDAQAGFHLNKVRADDPVAGQPTRFRFLEVSLEDGAVLSL